SGEDRMSGELLLRQTLEPDHERVQRAVADQSPVLRREDPRELVVIARRRRLRKCLFDEPVGEKPLGRAPVELADALGARGLELDTKQLAEEVVVAVPGTP